MVCLMFRIGQSRRATKVGTPRRMPGKSCRLQGTYGILLSSNVRNHLAFSALCRNRGEKSAAAFILMYGMPLFYESGNAGAGALKKEDQQLKSEIGMLPTKYRRGISLRLSHSDRASDILSIVHFAKKSPSSFFAGRTGFLVGKFAGHFTARFTVFALGEYVVAGVRFLVAYGASAASLAQASGGLVGGVTPFFWCFIPPPCVSRPDPLVAGSGTQFFLVGRPRILAAKCANQAAFSGLALGVCQFSILDR